MTLLLVDDDPMILLLASRVLEGAGYVVRQATSGEEALALASAEPPDALILDLHLEDMDGDALLARLRAEPGLEETPVVFLTGTSDARALDALAALGARGVISKPFDPGGLADRLNALLRDT